jgi:hypothetical protein
MAILISKRLVSEEEPTKLSVEPSQADFNLASVSVSVVCLPFVP